MHPFGRENGYAMRLKKLSDGRGWTLWLCKRMQTNTNLAFLHDLVFARPSGQERLNEHEDGQKGAGICMGGGSKFECSRWRNDLVHHAGSTAGGCTRLPGSMVRNVGVVHRPSPQA